MDGQAREGRVEGGERGNGALICEDDEMREARERGEREGVRDGGDAGGGAAQQRHVRVGQHGRQLIGRVGGVQADHGMACLLRRKVADQPLVAIGAQYPDDFFMH